jgi:hypothetical protein
MPTAASASRQIGAAPTLAAPSAEGPVDVNYVLEVLNTDMAGDGKPVERAEIEQALQTDPALRDAFRN